MPPPRAPVAGPCDDPFGAGLRGGLDALPCEAIAFDLDARVMLQNTVSLRERGSLVGRLLPDLAPDPETALTWVGMFRAALAGEPLRRDMRVGDAHGAAQWLQAESSVLRHEGEVVGLLTLVRDITARVRDGQALAQYADIFESMQIGVHIYALEDDRDDRSLRLIDANPAATAHTGVSSEQMLGRTIDENFPGLRVLGLPQAYAAVARSGKPASLGVVEYGDERIARASFSVRAFALPERRVGVVFENVTEHQRRQEAQQRSHKLESLGVMAGGLAHDLNNVLTVILGNLSLAREQHGSPEVVQESLADAELAVSRAQHLTRQLLTLSGTRRPVRAAVAVGEFLHEATALAFSGSGVGHSVYLADDLRPARADPGQMAQALHNVLRNAVDAMDGRGVVQVTAANRIVRGEDALPLAPGAYVEIRISDTGTGIAAADLPLIFDPYFTTREMGRGLGLAIAHSLIHGHGGHISASSRLGQGTTFTIFLPVGEPEVDTVEDLQPRPRGSIQRVLVMDDDPLVRGLAMRILASDGYEPTAAAHGQEAVGAVAAAMGRGQPFDAVILDLTVPGGMGGRQAVRLIRDLSPDIRAIVSSGYSADPVLTNHLAHGFDAAVSKPYTVTELRAALLGHHEGAVPGEDD